MAKETNEAFISIDVMITEGWRKHSSDYANQSVPLSPITLEQKLWVLSLAVWMILVGENIQTVM